MFYNSNMIVVVYLEGDSSPLPQVPTHMWGDNQVITTAWRMKAKSVVNVVNKAGYMLR